MNFIQRFLRNFDPRTPVNEYNSIIDHGDPDAMFVSVPAMIGPYSMKPPASLAQFASHYKRHADNGERIDPFRNAEVLCQIMSAEEWHQIEADALAAHNA